MKRLLAVTAILLVSATFALAQSKADKASQRFLSQAIEGNFAEVQMGELAQQHGQSEGVKSFGQTLASDHNAANQKAMSAAKSLGTTAPTGPSAKQKADYNKMSKLSGAAFDKAFVRHTVQDHRKDIKEYKRAAKKQDAAGQYAQNALPDLQKHLQIAESLEKPKTRGH